MEGQDLYSRRGPRHHDDIEDAIQKKEYLEHILREKEQLQRELSDAKHQHLAVDHRVDER